MTSFANVSADRVVDREVDVVMENSMTTSTDRVLNRDLGVFEDLMRQSLKEVHLNSEGDFYGYCEREEDVADLLSKLSVHGYAYSVRRSVYHNRKSSSNVSKNEPAFFFRHVKGSVPVQFFGPAFKIESLVKRECSLGPMYRDKEDSAIGDHLVDHVIPKKRRLITDTKKKNCPATLDVKCIRIFPEYKIKSATDSAKQSVIAKLKRDLASTQAPKSYLRFCVTASQAMCHNHGTDCVKATGQIHQLLTREIRDLVSQGCCSVRALKLHLERFVAITFTGENRPNRLNITYYPTDKTIYNHMYRALFELKKSTIDQVALQNLINEWEKESGDKRIFFRPFSDDGEKVQPLLFCYQSQWQMELLKKYGRVCLLDATYKTTKYAIPLFFLVVKTNVCYLVVGVFYVQGEKTSSIKEALDIFKMWNPEWSPASWVTDFSESEIRAIEGAFPRSKVYLCLFHRRQAWKRWLNNKDNLAVPADSKEIFKLWDRVADAPSEEEFLAATDELQTHPLLVRNKNALDYFNNQWLEEYERWVKAYEDQENIFANITTTNGVESLNKRLKHFFLQYSADKTLTGIIKVVVNDFLPSLYKRYCQKNSAVKSYNSDIPNFLHNRPHKFISHVMQRYSSVEAATTSVVEMGEGLFNVESFESKGRYYVVNFAKPNCTCCDFQQYKLPCKHFCFIFSHFPDWGFHKLNENYRNHSLICLDETHGIGSSRICSADTHPVSEISEDTRSVAPQPQERDNTTSSNSSGVQDLREFAKEVINLSYNSNKKGGAVDRTINRLIECVEDLQSCNPQEDGLPLVARK